MASSKLFEPTANSAASRISAILFLADADRMPKNNAKLRINTSRTDPRIITGLRFLFVSILAGVVIGEVGTGSEKSKESSKRKLKSTEVDEDVFEELGLVLDGV